MATEQKVKILLEISPSDDEYFRAEAGRVYGAKRGSLQKMYHRLIEVYKMHSGEQPVTA